MTAQDTLERRQPGSHAESPSNIPRRGWSQIAKRAWSGAKADQIPLIAAGVAFYSFLALFPAVIAGVLLYGLVQDPEDVRSQVGSWTDGLPADAASIITKQVDELTSTSPQSLGVGLVIALALALWSAAGGVGNLVTALNIAYDETDERGFVKKKLLALGLTLGAIVFVVITLALVAAAPAVLDSVVDSGPLRWGLEAARWLVLLVAMTGMLGVLYRVAPDREPAQFRWVSVGAVAATLGWLVASLGFSLYVDNFGSYGKTYGALAGVVVLLLWLWMTMLLVLLGAELNAEAEAQTEVDTTASDDEVDRHQERQSDHQGADEDGGQSDPAVLLGLGFVVARAHGVSSLVGKSPVPRAGALIPQAAGDRTSSAASSSRTAASPAT